MLEVINSMGLEAIGMSTAIAVITVLGGIWFSNHAARSPYGMNVTLPLLTALGSGMLLMICLLEFIPHSYSSGPASSISLLIFSGILIVVLFERYIAPRFDIGPKTCDHALGGGHHHHGAEEKISNLISAEAACTSVGCMVICAFFDGIALHSSFELGDRTGLLVGSSMALHVAPEGALASVMALAGGMSTRNANFSAVMVGVAVLLGTLVSALLGIFFEFEAFGLPVVTGVLLFVSFSHLLPAAMRSRFGLSGVALGALIVYMIGSPEHTHGHNHGYSHSTPRSLDGDPKSAERSSLSNEIQFSISS